MTTENKPLTELQLWRIHNCWGCYWYECGLCISLRECSKWIKRLEDAGGAPMA